MRRFSDASQRTGLYPDGDANLGARFAVHTCRTDVYFGPSTHLLCANIDSGTDAHTHRPNVLTGR